MSALKFEHLFPGVVVRGPLLPEPVSVITTTVVVRPEDGVSKGRIEEMKVALRELRTSEGVDVGEGQ